MGKTAPELPHFPASSATAARNFFSAALSMSLSRKRRPISVSALGGGETQLPRAQMMSRLLLQRRLGQEQIGQALIGVKMIGIERDGAAQRRIRFRAFAEMTVGLAQIVMDLRVARIALQRAEEKLGRR